MKVINYIIFIFVLVKLTISKKIFINNEDKYFNYSKTNDIDNLINKNEKNHIKYKRSTLYKNFDYEIIDDYYYSNVKESLTSAINSLSNAFEIYETIKIKIVIDNLYKYYKNVDKPQVQCLDVNFVALKTKNDENISPYYYPQALAKQLNTYGDFPYQDYDFVLLIDENSNYMDGNELKFEILHEMLHCLGFGPSSSIKDIYKPSNVFDVNNKDKFRYVPDFVVNNNCDTIVDMEDSYDVYNYLKNRVVIGYKPLSVYEKNLVDRNTGKRIFEDLDFLYKDINCYNNPITLDELNYTDCIKSLPSTTQQQLSDIRSNYYIKSESVGFLTSNNKIIPIQTFDDIYSMRQSLIHIEIKNNEYIKHPESYYYDEIDIETNYQEFTDENLLMYFKNIIPFDKYNIYLNVTANNRYGLISRDIISIMETMGWTEKGKTRLNTTTYYFDKNVPHSRSCVFEFQQRKYAIVQSSSIRNYSSSLKLYLKYITYFLVLILLY
eukprot:jgi/Orpsp1_1/1178555/evm.model.c7180000065824.1